jgi:hypothetical protein
MSTNINSDAHLSCYLDVQVSNARFVLLSDAEVPLYNAGATYMQLMLSHRSRTGRTLPYKETLRSDGVRACSKLWLQHLQI